MNGISRLYWTAKGVGWDNVPRRILQAYRVRSGWLRKRLAVERFTEQAFAEACPSGLESQERLWAERAKRFFPVPTPEDLAEVACEEVWDQRVIAICEEALAGRYLMFGHSYGELGWPPDFNRDPMNNLQWETGRHWLDGPDSLGGKADIKLVWEASRFSLAYYFARAYARSRDEKWAEAFWQMFDAWIEQNPCQQTVNWRCGQEMTFRLMAMLFAAVVTLPSEAATADRLLALTRLAWQVGLQLEANINSARSQKNNHAISEATGLWTIGLLFKELVPAKRWQEQGRRVLATEMRRQVYDDGSYVQHSMNYHRVMLDDMLWSIRLGELADDPLPAVVMDRFRRAAGWLWEMVDADSGRAPNYGANDGAQVLPLSCCDYLDYRPVAQASRFVSDRAKCLHDGEWNEKLLWLYGQGALKGPAARPKQESIFAANDGGYYILRGPNSRAMTRCHTYRDRPSQADMLHVDLWYRGENILRDAGTYSYNCHQPWQHYFLATAAHNTVEIDGQDQMVKGPRFLWFKWTRSRLLRFETSPDGRVGYFEGEHYGYTDQPGKMVHRRGILRVDDTYFVIDDVLGGGRHDVCLRWRLCPGDWREDQRSWHCQMGGRTLVLRMEAEGSMETELLSGHKGPDPQGWASVYYGRKAPVPTLIARAEALLPVCIVTVIGPTEEEHGFACARPSPASGGTLPDVRVTGVENASLRAAARRILPERIHFES